MAIGEACTSRNIPEPMQREIRRRCGFGCVFCGLPLYEYDHIRDWAQVRKHVAEDITLLCDTHHREKTSGLLPVSAVVAANNAPFNLVPGASTPYSLHFAPGGVEIEVGGIKFTQDNFSDGDEFHPFVVDGTSLVSLQLQDGHLLLNLVSQDDKGNPLIEVRRNQLIYSTSPWDVQLVGRRLTFRRKLRDILLELEFDPPHRLVVLRGSLIWNRAEIAVGPDFFSILNKKTTWAGDFVFKNFEVCFEIGKPCWAMPAIKIGDFPRDGFNRRRALMQVKRQLKEASGGRLPRKIRKRKKT